MGSILVKNGKIINEGRRYEGDLLIRSGRIEKIDRSISVSHRTDILDAQGKIVMPGIIDDQVHFREPGLTHKADIASESRAALMGGVTSFMEMPNTKPPALTQELLENKYQLAEKTAYSNYSFYMGASNENVEQVLRTDGANVCGVKIFMGSSTGNMLVDDRDVLEKLFAQIPILVATHCEDEATIRNNRATFLERYGDQLSAEHHPLIRSREGCLLSSSMAVDLAKRHGTRLHILHISTADELALFSNEQPLDKKQITAEVCVHHLYFNADDYRELGNKIVCNPAIKSKGDQQALWRGLLENRLDIIATDHAPHLLDEKKRPYSQAPSGLPLVQHSLVIMLDFYHRGLIDLETMVHKMCHAPAVCFQIKDRGFLREGYHADLLVVDPNQKHLIAADNVLYKCGWSPLEGRSFKGAVSDVILNGDHVVSKGQLTKKPSPQRLAFDRK